MTSLMQSEDDVGSGIENSTTINDVAVIIEICTDVGLIGLKLLLIIVTSICIVNGSQLFLRRHGLSHRVAGGLHLLVLLVGTWTADIESSSFPTNRPALNANDFYFAYDLALGFFGITATLTAAEAFPHKLVKNIRSADGKHLQSGTLHKHAIVTSKEMVEHSFYQGLNLVQATYLHVMYRIYQKQQQDTAERVDSHNYEKSNNWDFSIYQYIALRLVLLWIVTSPWLVRHRWPVSSFSDNWKLQDKWQKQKQSTEQPLQQLQRQRTNESVRSKESALSPSRGSDDVEIWLYKIKKGQYIFYKHCILHGVNIAVAVASVSSSASVVATAKTQQQDLSVIYDYIPYSKSWRVFWMLLNTSYVMEFFLQTLVKRHIIDQTTMLWLQRLLMTAASFGSVVVVAYYFVQPMHMWTVVLSIALNFVHRHHDVSNTLLVGVLATAINIVAAISGGSTDAESRVRAGLIG